MQRMCLFKTCKTLAVLLVFYLHASAQGVKEPTFASPNASALGKFGDIPVNSHTGVPSIGIPIHTIEEGPLKLPITLSYHASGIRVGETASWVGLGWSLSAGGMITRTVNGGPDEGISQGTMPGGTSPLVGKGWYKDYGIIQEIFNCQSRPISIDGPQIGTFPAWGGCAAIYREAAKGYIDTEPDLYTFNFSGYSGKFFFDTNRKVHMIPEADVYIEPVNTPGYFYAWKIIAPDGTRYFFGGNATEISYSDPTEASGNKQVSSSTTWYLYRIESVNGEHWINLDYANETYSFGNRGGHSVSFVEYGATYGQLIGDVDDASAIINASIVDGKRLTQITTSSGYTTINFVPSNSPREDLTQYYLDGSIPIFNLEQPNTIAKSLQQIQILTGSSCRIIDFFHDYYWAADCTGCVGTSWYGSSYDRKRLRLRWIRESSCSGLVVLPKHEFFYDPTPIPRRYSLARDKWEYYNGFEYNKGLLEQFSNPVPGVTMTYATGNFRSVDESKSKAGILTRIVYPTGGASDFTYECHRISDGSPLVGGLRIKTIVNSDNQGNTVTRNFKYATGKLYLDPANYQYQYPNNNDNFTYASIGGFDYGISHLSNPLPPMWSSHGYHFGYEQSTTEETNNGSTVINYMNISPAIINPGQYPLKPLVAAIGTGEAINELIKRNDNQILRQTTYSRGLTGSTITTVNARKVQLVNCVSQCSGANSSGYGLWTDYSITTNRFNLLGKTDMLDGVITTTSYTYDASGKHNFPIAEELTNSRGVVEKTETIYPSDPTSGAPEAMYVSTNPIFKNMLGMPVEQKTYVGGVLASRTLNQYSALAGKILLTKNTIYPTGNTDYMETIYEYDGFSNPVIFKKSDGIDISFLYGYQGRYPIGVIKNAAVNQVILSSFTSGSQITSNVSTCSLLGGGSFTLHTPQAITPVISVQGYGFSTTLSILLGSTVVFGPKVYMPGQQNYTETIPLNAGNYQYCYTVSGYSGAYGSINITTSYLAPVSRPIAFHSSFEEDGQSDLDAKTGDKVKNGTYNLVMPGVLGTYKISYWKRPAAGGAWQLEEQTVTTSSITPPDVVLGQSGYVIDEVRLIPANAQMTTYTYEPAVGIITQTDLNNQTVRYQRDDLNRLQLIKEDNSIIKTFRYNFKQ